MAGSNEGNEGNEGNSGSLGRGGGGGGFSVLPDRVDLPFVSVGNLAEKHLPRSFWRDRDWAGDWAAFLTLADFAGLNPLLYAPPTPTVTATAKPGNKGGGTVSSASAQPMSWQAGTYSLTCKDPADGGTFELCDPLGNMLLRFAIGTNTTIAVTNEVSFTIAPGSPPFATDDAFAIEVSPGAKKLWLNGPPACMNLLQAEVRVSASPTNTHGSCRINARQPALWGIVTGDYKLECSGVSGGVATFNLKDPSGNSIGTYTLANADGKAIQIANRVHCKLSVGAGRFSVNDSFTITVQPNPEKLVITPKPKGNVGAGTCIQDQTTPVANGARIGIYRLRCIAAAGVGGAQFEFLDPDGNQAPGSPLILAGSPSSIKVSTPLGFTLTDGTPAFAKGDGFDLDVGGFEEAELPDLVRAAEDERADALGEIIAQHDSFISYFMAAMSISPKSHPATCQLLHIGSLIGAYVSMHFKGMYLRCRPSQRVPALLPPVPIPGHPAYPSGHSTQAHLMALCVKHALPSGIKDPLGAVLDALADRIARNREIAGLHFGSDSAAGAALAAQAFAILKLGAMPTIVPQSIPPDTAVAAEQRFAAIVKAATAEWE